MPQSAPKLMNLPQFREFHRDAGNVVARPSCSHSVEKEFTPRKGGEGEGGGTLYKRFCIEKNRKVGRWEFQRRHPPLPWKKGNQICSFLSLVFSLFTTQSRFNREGIIDALRRILFWFLKCDMKWYSTTWKRHVASMKVCFVLFLKPSRHFNCRNQK